MLAVQVKEGAQARRLGALRLPRRANRRLCVVIAAASRKRTVDDRVVLVLPVALLVLTLPPCVELVRVGHRVRVRVDSVRFRQGLNRQNPGSPSHDNR